MKKAILFSIFFTGILNLSFSQSDIVITELMYNNPGTDSLEFIELYNKGNNTVDLSGFTFTAGVTYTFPASSTLDAGAYLILATDQGAVERFLGVSSAIQWSSGALSNSGEAVQLEDGMGNVVDRVEYDDVFPWPDEADGLGSSLVLCDFNADNEDPANWWPAFTDTGQELFDTKILANPEAASSCPAGPYARFLNSESTIAEDGGSIDIPVVLKRGIDPVTLNATVDQATSTATSGSDFTIVTASVNFPANANPDTMMFSVSIIDDMDEEVIEIAGLALTTPATTTLIYPNAANFNINIIDNDRPLAKNMRISGVFDTQPDGAGAKGVEVYVSADIPDLSLYGIGSANNGGGSDGLEFNFPAGSAVAGQCIYLTDDTDDFLAFFGFAADYETTAMSINGDDAIELFENNQVIDVFGDINVDGNGTPWEYLDGWAYRRSGTGPDDDVFVEANWSYSGVGALSNVATNAAASNPFPSCSYSPVAPSNIDAIDDNVTTDINTPVDIMVLNNDVLPGGVSSVNLVAPPRGSASFINSTTVRYTPELDFCGGSDSFTYEVCDANSCDTATVTVTVICPPTFPAYDIGLVTSDNDGNGLPDSLETDCTLTGIVHGVDLRGGDGVQFTIIDATGGIAVFDFDISYYDVTEGDEVTTVGKIGHFNGLAQINPDTIILNSSGNATVTPVAVSALDESTESELIRLNNMRLVDPAEWTNAGFGFNVRITNSVDTFVMRIDDDVDIFGTSAPSTELNITGIGGQFDSSSPFTDDYQILPRYLPDLEFISTVNDPSLAKFIRVYPNPAGPVVWIESKISLDQISIRDLSGRELLTVPAPDLRKQVDLGDWPSGTYWITFVTEGRSWTTTLIKD